MAKLKKEYTFCLLRMENFLTTIKTYERGSCFIDHLVHTKLLFDLK